MKKVILTLAVAIIALSANAQHKFFLGMDLGFSTSKAKNEVTYSGTGAGTAPFVNSSTDGAKTTSFKFNPYLGYSVTERIAVGLGLGIVNGKSVDGTETTLANGSKVNLETKSTSFAVSPFVRYNFPINDNLSMWGQLKVSPKFGKEVHQHVTAGVLGEHETKLGGLDAGISPGFNYKLGERWIFTGSYGFLGYMSDKETTETTSGGLTMKNVDKTSGFGLDLNWNTLAIGFNFLF